MALALLCPLPCVISLFIRLLLVILPRIDQQPTEKAGTGPNRRAIARPDPSAGSRTLLVGGSGSRSRGENQEDGSHQVVAFEAKTQKACR
jgi:hypothetical protein